MDGYHFVSPSLCLFVSLYVFQHSRRQWLRREIQAEHAAVEFFHVDQAAGDFDGVADLLHAADREPADPFAAGTRLAGAGVDERMDAAVIGQFQADADLLVGANAGLPSAKANPRCGNAASRHSGRPHICAVRCRIRRTRAHWPPGCNPAG